MAASFNPSSKTPSALLLPSLAAVLALLLGGNLLTLCGSHYVTAGGWLAEKLHPSSYVAFTGAMFTVFAVRVPGRGFARRHRLLFGSIFCFAGATGWALLFSGASTVVVLLDNFLAASCFGVAVADASVALQRRLRVLLQSGFALNALLALAESAAGLHVLPLYIDGVAVTERAEDFRPLALYDHPLTGAAATLMGLSLLPRAFSDHIAS